MITSEQKMIEIKITGASDDLIEIEGDISEEFNWITNDSDERRFIAVSDGTLLSVRYDADGIWRFDLVANGSAEYSKSEGSVARDTNDVITLRAPVGDRLQWVVFGTDKITRKF